MNLLIHASTSTDINKKKHAKGRVWLSNHMPLFYVDVITYLSRNPLKVLIFLRKINFTTHLNSNFEH